MEQDEAGRDRPEPATEGGRVLVEDEAGRRPFMRGILIHSLMARGVSYEDAFRAANEIRRRMRGRAVVSRVELAQAARELIGPEAFGDEPVRISRSAEIIVTGHGRDTPFSKGILSQSLLAAAIDPNDAFDVAREIEQDLLGRGTSRIDRPDLRQVAYETLKVRTGPQIAERYLVWRRFQEPDRPVILLLGGSAGAGKTSLALEVASRLGIHRVVSTDAIRQVMRIMLSQDLVPAVHSSSYDAYKVLARGTQVGDPVVEGFRDQAQIVSVGVRAIIDRAIAESASVIIDGVSVVPGMIDLDAYKDRAEVVFLLVATLDPDAFRSRFASRAKGETNRLQHRYLEHLDAILRIQDHLLELADQFNVPIVDNQYFDRSVLSIIRHLIETLRKKSPQPAPDLPESERLAADPEKR
jgi:2-phosphoglycerate kinase